MSDVVQFEKRDDIGLITVDSPPVNALSQAVRQGLVDSLKQALESQQVRALVLACKGRTFIAGADITEFGKPPLDPPLPDVIDAYDRSDIPVVAAIHGTALGGGLEVALGCHYRVALRSAKVGLPEVKLGILPGAGGTQRLPRLIGVEKALDMIVSGNPVDAEEAQKLGIIDQVVESDLVNEAIEFARSVCDRRPLPRPREMGEHVEAAKRSEALFDAFEKKVQKRARGARAPLRCVEAVRAAVELPFEEGMKRERELMAEALQSTESKAMRHVFFAERTAAKIPDVPKDTPTRTIERVGVLGAGTMGGGIAMVFANAGMDVLLLDREQELVDKGRATIEKNYAATVKKGRLSKEKMEERLGRIAGTTNWDALADRDLVIEAVFEDMNLKKEIFGKLESICKKDAILATNTSTLDVNEIAASTSRPERVVGLHFFSPANVMRLLEVVRGDKTDPSVVATCMKLAKSIGKVGVLVGVCYGFVGNRMLHKYYREANFLLQEGASPEQLDRVMTEFGMAMGPCATSDLAGVDVGWRIRKSQPKPPPGERYFGAVPDRLAEMGRFGQKTGKGFFKYEEGSRTPIPDPEVDRVIEEVAKEQGVERRKIDDQEILDRCLFAMINEGAKILDEGIALRASDIDTVWINGYAFPSHRGGPMFHADEVGLKAVYHKLIELGERLGQQYWEPSPLLERLGNEGKTFASYDEQVSA